MRGKACACTGHRPQNLPFRFDETDDRCKALKERLYKTAEELIINEGVSHFISGMALGVDTFFAEAVIELRNTKYHGITVEAAIPCETQSLRWTEVQRDRYYSITEQCDVETLLQTAYTPDCMSRRNRYMVDNCDYLIAVWDGSSSGTGATVRYARQNNKPVIYIDPGQLMGNGDDL